MAENTILSLCFPCPTPAQAGGPADEAITTAFQHLCVDIGHSHHCQAILDVSINSTQAKKRLSIETHQSVYNVTITGAYQNVMSARGAFMRSNPLKVMVTFTPSHPVIHSSFLFIVTPFRFVLCPLFLYSDTTDCLPRGPRRGRRGNTKQQTTTKKPVGVSWWVGEANKVREERRGRAGSKGAREQRSKEQQGSKGSC
jgi:hypothetical protein